MLPPSASGSLTPLDELQSAFEIAVGVAHRCGETGGIKERCSPSVAAGTANALRLVCHHRLAGVASHPIFLFAIRAISTATRHHF
jgi:hypothetical protein